MVSKLHINIPLIFTLGGEQLQKAQNLKCGKKKDRISIFNKCEMRYSKLSPQLGFCEDLIFH